MTAPADSTGPEETRLRLSTSRLRQLGRPYRAATAAVAVVSTGGALLELAAVVAIMVALDHLLAGRGSRWEAVLIASALTLAARLADEVGGRLADRRQVDIRVSLRARLFRQLGRLGPAYLVDHRSGAIETSLTEGVDGLADYYARTVPAAAAAATALVVATAIVAARDPLVGAIMVASALVVVVGPVLSARAFGAGARTFGQTLATTTAEYLDAIQGLATLQAFGASRRWADRLHLQQQDLAEDETALAAMANMHIGFATLAVAAGTTVTVAVGVSQATRHHLDPQGLLIILGLGLAGFRILTRAAAQIGPTYRTTSLAEGIFELLDAAPVAPESAQPVLIDRARAGRSLRFEGVTFAYRPDRPPALEQVSLAVERGQLLAVVGPSGAGKSTLVSLLWRVFDPGSGRILIDGVDTRSLALADLRALVAVTFQDHYLFNRSVADNLRLGRPDATDAELEEAARQANAHEFICALPDGYASSVGERGTRLSGGQRQRLALAAALVSRAPIVVLDEPTANVDGPSEALIVDAIDRLRRDRIVIVIAHQMATVAQADQVLELADGRLGTPRVLR